MSPAVLPTVLFNRRFTKGLQSILRAPNSVLGCVLSCPAGFYLVAKRLARCEPCTLGSWCTGGMDAKTSCGMGRTTIDVGSQTESECICAPGYTSSTSLSGCEACGLNSFKSTTGPAGCDRCPGDMITYRTDSTSESACVCKIGSVLEDGLCVQLARIYL